VAAADAGRVLRHELRRRNTNGHSTLPGARCAAQVVIERYAAEGRRSPANGSPDALHCDHVFTLTDGHLAALTTQDAWLARLPEFDLVVCVTAVENYRLEQRERKGTDGWAKYAAAGVEMVADAVVP
jgi:hypothetical protein